MVGWMVGPVTKRGCFWMPARMSSQTQCPSSPSPRLRCVRISQHTPHWSDSGGTAIPASRTLSQLVFTGEIAQSQRAEGSLGPGQVSVDTKPPYRQKWQH